MHYLNLRKSNRRGFINPMFFCIVGGVPFPKWSDSQISPREKPMNQLGLIDKSPGEHLAKIPIRCCSPKSPCHLETMSSANLNYAWQCPSLDLRRAGLIPHQNRKGEQVAEVPTWRLWVSNRRELLVSEMAVPFFCPAFSKKAFVS